METESLLTGSINQSTDYGSQFEDGHHGASKNDDIYIQQAVIFLEDAIQYRSINHRVDSRSLHLYRWYYSKFCQWGLGTTIAVILGLAFFERPSSWSYTSDPRHKPLPWEPACGLTESIEMVCLCIFIADFAIKSYLIGWDEFWKTKWLIGYILAIAASFIDWTLSLSMLCEETFRVRRIIRPFFLLQNSSLMKKTLKCLKRTLPEIASVILLLALHLCLFTMFGMMIFARTENPEHNGEWESYFKDMPQSLSSLLVLLTTANNPDVMIPAYSLNRGYSIFFILFSVFGTYFLMNLLTAIIYNQFRGYLLMSVQTSIHRRRLGIQAAFVVLCFHGQDHTKKLTGKQNMEVQVSALLEVLQRVQMKSYYRQAIIKKICADTCITGQDFQRLFDELDKDQIKETADESLTVNIYNNPIIKKIEDDGIGRPVVVTSMEVQVSALLEVLQRVQMKSYYRQAIIKKICADTCITGQDFQRLFDELDKDQIKEHPPKPEYNQLYLQRLQSILSHYSVTVLGNALALANVICICTVLVLDSEKTVTERDDYLEVINCVFILLYLLEMSVKTFALGWRGYLSYRINIFDGMLTILLLILQISIFATYKLPFFRRKEKQGIMSLWEMVRLINMLIVFRFLRIISDIKLMTLVASTLVDLVKNLRAFAGILVVVYYIYAVLGIWLFKGAISPPAHNSTFNSSMEIVSANFSIQCGTYEQLEYWANNFDDFASSLVLLYNIMVVNNWHVFTDAYTRYTTEWSKVYFVSWWLISSVMWVNLFIALILENFTYRWDHSHAFTVVDVERTAYQTSVQLMFREHVQEPTVEQLMATLQQHPHLHLTW